MDESKTALGLPKTHRVVACQGGDRTRIEHRPLPEPGPGEILLRMRLTGLCGTDLFKLATGRVTPGQVLGHEVVGEVAALGKDAPPFEPGDRVVVPHHVPCGECILCQRGNETMCALFQENLMAPGGFAEFILVKPRAARVAARTVPPHVTDDAALYLEPAACVLRGIQRAKLPLDGFVVVQGAGSMGLLHLLVLRASLPRVLVTVVDPLLERLTLARHLGAQQTARPGADALETVRESSGEGADAVFDTVGGSGPLQAGLGLLRKGGALVLFAHGPESASAAFDLNEFFKHEKRLLGTYSGALREQQEVFDLLTTGRLDPRPLNTHRLKLEDFDQGVALTRERRALKVVFENT